MKRFLLLLLLASMLVPIKAQKIKQNKNINSEWTIEQSWDIPGKASGLAWDGSFIYFGIYGSDGDHIYKFDPVTGTSTLQFITSAIEDCYGLSWDGSQLWTTDHPGSPSSPAQALELDMSGNNTSSFNLPDHYMSGIAYDAGNFWVGTYYPDPGTIYKVSGSGTILSQFTPPEEQIWDICLQGNDLWMVDYNANMIYKTTKSGTLLESHASENIKPSGIVYDGTYIWYVDGQLSSDSKLYKVNLTGEGTPEITIPADSHNYGNVTIGASETWQMLVQNTGTANLEITGISIPSDQPISTSMNFPQIISPGNSIFIPITYTPLAVEPLSTIINIESSDPLTPSYEVSLSGHGVNSGPSIKLIADSHNYGEVRMFAFTRWFMEIVNIGDENLNIESITSDLDAFIVEESTAFPINISTLDTVKVGIWFNPQKEWNYSGQISISNNDTSNNPYLVALSGNSIPKNYAVGEPLWHFNITTSYDQSPKAISTIQDITGDTVADVIVCSEDNYLRCFNGNSSGVADVMWEMEIYSGNVYDQTALQITQDINNDGYEDVVIGTTGGDRSVIALSGKTGHQIWKHQTNEYGDGGWVYDLDISHDYNNDGFPDVLATTGDDSQDTGPKRVYCLDVLTGLSIWETPIGGPVFSVIGVQDFTGDGISDAIAGASSADETEGRVFGISGSDGLIQWTRHTNGSSVWALLQLDDITGDNIKDIAIGDFAGNYLLINPVNNAQIHAGTIPGALILRFDKLEDVNADGYLDVLVANSKTKAIVIDGYTGDYVWSKNLVDKSWNVAAIGDINKDGINDVIAGTLFSSNYCYFLDGTNGEEIKNLDYSTPIDAINSIPDIVGDGTMEMVAGGRNGKVYCYSGGFNFYVDVEENKEPLNELFSTNYPNPFSYKTTISINLESESIVSLNIIDLSGKIVKTLYQGKLNAGTNSFVWDGKDGTGTNVHPGFYVYELNFNKGRISRKMAKIR